MVRKLEVRRRLEVQRMVLVLIAGVTMVGYVQCRPSDIQSPSEYTGDPGYIFQLIAALIWVVIIGFAVVMHKRYRFRAH